MLQKVVLFSATAKQSISFIIGHQLPKSNSTCCIFFFCSSLNLLSSCSRLEKFWAASSWASAIFCVWPLRARQLSSSPLVRIIMKYNVTLKKIQASTSQGPASKLDHCSPLLSHISIFILQSLSGKTLAPKSRKLEQCQWSLYHTFLQNNRWDSKTVGGQYFTTSWSKGYCIYITMIFFCSNNLSFISFPACENS